MNFYFKHSSKDRKEENKGTTDIEVIQKEYPKDYLIYSFIPIDWIMSPFYLYRKKFRDLYVTSFLEPVQEKICIYAAIVSGYICSNQGIILSLEDPYTSYRTQPIKNMTEKEASELLDCIILVRGKISKDKVLMQGYTRTKFTRDGFKNDKISDGIETPKEYQYVEHMISIFGESDCVKAIDEYEKLMKSKRWYVWRFGKKEVTVVAPGMQISLFEYKKRLFIIRDEIVNTKMVYEKMGNPLTVALAMYPQPSSIYRRYFPEDLKERREKVQYEQEYESRHNR